MVFQMNDSVASSGTNAGFCDQWKSRAPKGLQKARAQREESSRSPRKSREKRERSAGKEETAMCRLPRQSATPPKERDQHTSFVAMGGAVAFFLFLKVLHESNTSKQEQHNIAPVS